MSLHDLPPATSTKINMIMNDLPKLRKLKIELAMTIDAMAPFVKSTYTLEGNGLLALIAYREISKLHSEVTSPIC